VGEEQIIGKTTFYRMRRQMDENENPKFSYQALMTKNGRPKVYSEGVNEAFIK